MTSEQMKEWIDQANYQTLLAKWRWSPIGSPWFQGEVGAYYIKVMAERRAELEKLPSESGGIGTAASDASKIVGWER